MEAWSAQHDQDSIGAIRTGLGLGINWIDTAAVYGLGHSEIVVGCAIWELRVCGDLARMREWSIFSTARYS